MLHRITRMWRRFVRETRARERKRAAERAEREKQVSKWASSIEEGRRYETASFGSSEPWWESASTRAVREYTDSSQFDFELRRAALKGWYIEAMNTTDGHINVGRTVTGTILTGGVYAMLGGSRTKGTTMVIYAK